jgi:DNA-binding IclR family transcriptional regulator
MSIPPPPDVTKSTPLSHGISVVRLMVQCGHSLGVTRLAEELGMPKSSVHRLLITLQELGFVQKIEETKRYTLSADIFDFVHEIASHFGRNLSLDDRLRAAASKFGVSVYLSMLGKRDTYVICAAGDEGNTTKLGSHGRAYATSAGKVLIAHLDEKEWSLRAPPTEEKSITPYTIRDPQKFFAQLREVKKTGIAWNRRESSKDHVSLATVVREPFIRQPRLAVAFLMRHEELALRDHKELEQALLKLAADLERKLGRR